MDNSDTEVVFAPTTNSTGYAAVVNIKRGKFIVENSTQVVRFIATGKTTIGGSEPDEVGALKLICAAYHADGYLDIINGGMSIDDYAILTVGVEDVLP